MGTPYLCFSEIERIAALKPVVIGTNEFACDWSKLQARLRRIPRLTLRSLTDVSIAPAFPPNEAMELAVDEVQMTPAGARG
jgi:hypothetical protein